MDNLHDESQFKKMQQELNDIQNLYTDQEIYKMNYGKNYGL